MHYKIIPKGSDKNYNVYLTQYFPFSDIYICTLLNESLKLFLVLLKSGFNDLTPLSKMPRKYCLWAGWPRFDSYYGTDIFPISTTSKSVLGPSQSVYSVLNSLPCDTKWVCPGVVRLNNLNAIFTFNFSTLDMTEFYCIMIETHTLKRYYMTCILMYWRIQFVLS
jgi:hypothetical protein